MKDRTVEEMAQDEKLVEQTRATLKEKELKRIADKKRIFKQIGAFLGFYVTAIIAVICINNFFDQKMAEDMVTVIREQGLIESRFVEKTRADIRRKKFRKKIDEQKQVEADYKLKHSPNIVIVFQVDDYLAGVKSLKLFNKPYFTCQSFRFQYIDKEENAWKYQYGFVVTSELEGLLKNTGVRYQRQDVGYDKGCPRELDEVMASPFVNW